MQKLIALTVMLLAFTACTDESASYRILFDQGHGQAFTIENEGELQLGQLADLLRGSGLKVQATTAELTPERLKDIDALIISGPFRPFSEQEVATIRAYTEGGGRVAVLLHVAQPLWGLLDALGVDVANGVLHEQGELIDDLDINFRVTDLSEHVLTRDLHAFNLYGGWPLRPAGDHARIIARTGDQAWVDLNGDRLLNNGDAMQSFGVVVGGTLGNGEFVVFADDAIFQNRFLDKNNRKLAENLGQWLAGS